jgi:hypothetical protein
MVQENAFCMQLEASKGMPVSHYEIAIIFQGVESRHAAG